MKPIVDRIREEDELPKKRAYDVVLPAAAVFVALVVTVPQDAYTDAGQEDQRQQEAVHGDHQHHSAKRHGNTHVNPFLLFHQLLCIRDNRG